MPGGMPIQRYNLFLVKTFSRMFIMIYLFVLDDSLTS